MAKGDRGGKRGSSSASSGSGFITDNSGHKYKVVDKIPDGYKVWNASAEFEKPIYTPLVQSKEGFRVNTETMMALKSTEEDTAALRDGNMGTIGDAQKYVDRYKGRTLKTGFARRKFERAQKALEAFRKYS